MHLTTPAHRADYDWLLTWPHWAVLPDFWSEAAFPLETFLQRSQAVPATWRLDFLSWKCERLAIDGCWYEMHIEELPDHTQVRIVVGR